MQAPAIEHYLADLEPRSADTPDEVVHAVRRYVGDVRAYLEKRHANREEPGAINASHSDLMDRLIRRLFEMADAAHYAEGGDVEQHFAVIAVGGYARREMSIRSDIDLLLLYAEPITPYITAVAQSVQYRLWDAGLSVGCATRTIAETFALASQDPTVRTAILDARFLTGDVEIFHEFRDALRERLFDDPAAFIAERVEALRERHEKYGESLYLLQPNLKEGVGGLRDYHTAYWVARTAHRGLRGLDDLLHLGLLTEREMEEYRGALAFLWSVRNELHLTAGRRTDQLSFDLQDRIAEKLGYALAPSETGELPVERFMGAYYRHARAVRGYSEIVIEQCQRHVAPATRKRASREVEDGFRVVGSQLEVPHAAHLRERPVRLLRAFAIAQTQDLPLSRTALRLIRDNLDLVDDAFRREPEVAACFERILSADNRVMRSLMAMNDVGLLGAYLPEWDHIVCRWQQVLYHTYTVDVHSIFLVEQLRRLQKGKYETEVPELTALVRAIDDRVVLYLGCLLHDVGKGRGGSHSERGADLARACLARIGFPAERAERVVFLVRHHLLMSHIAQRRDLSEPRLIAEFAQVMGDRTNLRNLYLLTFADTRASSAGAWSEWKRMLLAELFLRAADYLETGAEDESRALEQIEAEVERRRVEAREALRTQDFPEASIGDFLDTLPRRYFIAHSAPQIVSHARLAMRFDPRDVVATAVEPSHGGAFEIVLVTRDRHGLYAMSAGVLTSKGINVHGANAYTTREGLAIEIYRIDPPPGGDAEQREVFQSVEDTLRRVLRGEERVEDLLRRRRRPVLATASPSRRPCTVEITSDESDFYTIVDVAANDRLGLLYDLTRVIAANDFEIYISKASTVLDQVADTFYLKDFEGRKVTDAERLERLRKELLAVAREEPAGDRV
ncbi:MAG: [protein-PII] uridylyltransferase [Deltaproteobacteria bacterium]|nr:MAG: [protein-PII] uridylyltransferase [Deltaproteobacteria bacterium]